MHVNYRHKQNDRLPKFRGTLRDKNGVVDVSAATSIKIFMRPYGGGTLKVNGSAVTTIDGPNGLVEYAWAAVDVDTPGFYELEIQVTFGANGNETFPNDGFFAVEIVDDLGS